MSDSENEEEMHQEEEEEEEEENGGEEEQVEEQVEEEGEVEEETGQLESDDEEFAGFGEEELKQSKKIVKRKVLSDDEGEQEEEVVEEEEEEEEQQDEEELVENNDEEQQEEAAAAVEEEEEEEEETIQKKSKKDSNKKSDLEEAIEKHNNKKKNRRKKDDSETITNFDNTIALLVTEMKNAAAEDRAANEKRICSIKKLKMLEMVTNMLQKADHYATMIELGMLGAITEWLAPLPDRSLPNIKIREILINTLQEFGEIDSEYLKSSGVGKAVMFLYKHPKETKQNKEKLEKLIHTWSRPIFSLDSNFKGLSKEERQQRDMDHVKSIQKRSLSEDHSSQNDIDNVIGDKYSSNQKSNKKQKGAKGGDTNALLRPGDAGFCPRARVPVPSNKDYVIRPKSNLDNVDIQEKKTKKPESRLDKHKKRFIELKKQSKSNKAVAMSIEGKKLPL